MNFSKISNKAYLQMLEKKEEILNSTLKDFLNIDKLDNDELKNKYKCSGVILGGIETYFVDGTPILEFHSVESKTIVDGEKTFLNQSQKYRRLF